MDDDQGRFEYEVMSEWWYQEDMDEQWQTYQENRLEEMKNEQIKTDQRKRAHREEGSV